jgi:Neuraminidase-like domain/Putative peptidoglycan binding domain/Salmonella virulence plasmid 28.1kDa A protein
VNLAGRDLKTGDSGDDVRELHTELNSLGYTVPQSDQQGASFGAGTNAAVRQFQTDHSLPATGTVDTATAAALSSVIRGSTYTVTGTVTSSVSAGVNKLTVELVDKNVGGDVALTSGSTDASGSYIVKAFITAASLLARRKTSPDLQVRVSTGSSVLAVSSVRYDAPLAITLDVALPADTVGLPSEYETLTASMAEAYAGKLGALVENDARQDITYLANKIGLDARLIALAALADQSASITVPTTPAPAVAPAPAAVSASPSPTVTAAPTAASQPAAPPASVAPPQPTAAPAPTTPPPATAPTPTAPQSTAAPATATAPQLTAATAPTPAAATAPASAAPPPPTTLKAEFYYALFRAGLPTDAATLLQASATTVEAIWQEAITAGVISQSLKGEVAGAVTTFQTLSAANGLDTKPTVGVSTLRQMLAPSLPGATQQAQFALLYARYSDNPTLLWTNVQAAFGAVIAHQLQLDGQLYYLTLNNAPVVAGLKAAQGTTPITSTLDLATRGYYDPAKWVPLIGQSVPLGIAGSTIDVQRTNYAALLAAQVRIAHFTTVVGDLVQRGTLPLSRAATGPADVAAFLAANQSAFDIGAEPVAAFLQRSGITGTAPTVVTEVARLQRVLRIADYNSAGALLRQGLDSSFAITRYDEASFVRAFSGALGGNQAAQQIHARAKQTHNVVLNVAISYLLARQAPTLGGGAPVQVAYSAPPQSSPYPVIAYPTLESLFGSLDYCDCPDCRSILSPAAYLVDLLNRLDVAAPSAGFQNPQAALFLRRPDLQYLPLTCANTNTALPYIDVVNETLEFFVAHNLSLANFQGYDTGTTLTSAELIASPQNVDNAAYTVLAGVFFPPPLPFNRPLALLRLHLSAIGISLRDAMAALRASDAIERGTAAYGWRDILMEQLGISREEYRIFTDGTLKLQGLYGYPTLTDATVLATLQTMSLQDFSRRTGVSYSDLFTIVTTRFVNPNSALIPRLQQLNMPFSALQTLKNGASDPTVVAQFEAVLPAGLDAREYGGSTATDLDAVVAWVTDAARYARIMAIITITNPTDDTDLCSASTLQFRYSNPDNTANTLSATDFVKLIRFIRLWQKLGLSIAQTDAILAALYPPADLPNGNNDTINLPLLDAGFLVLLPRLGVLMQVVEMLNLPVTTALLPLLACWAPIDTTGAPSLYAAMFLSPTLAEPDLAFADDGYGNYLNNQNEPFLNHQATLCAAFNLTGAEFTLITGNAVPGALGFGPTTPLTLANVSAVFRIGWLAHTLNLSVLEFLLLRQATGLDPFAPLDPSPTPPAEPPAVRFIRLLQALTQANLRPVQALYLIWNRDISGNSAPSEAQLTGLAVALRADFAAVDAQFALVDDPDGSIAKNLMTLVYGTATTDFFFGLIDATMVTAVPCAAAQPTLVQPIIDASAGRLSYDDLRKQLSFAGVLDSTVAAAIDQAITANGNDAALHAALASLATASQNAVAPFFAQYPELQPLYTAYVASTGTVQARNTALLANFLPTLKDKRKQEQALASVTAEAGTDPSFATALLQDATLIHAAAATGEPALADLTGIETQGLAVAFFLGNNPAAAPDQTFDAAAGLNYAPATANTLPPGSGGGPIAGLWIGYLDVPQDGFYNIAVTADAGATVTLAIGGDAVPMAAVGVIWKNQAAIALTAGAPAAIRLAAVSLKTTFQVEWQSQGLGWEVVPQPYLYSATLIDRLRTTYVRFLKATSLATALSLDADEIAWLAAAARLSVATTDKTDTLAAGAVTFTPLSMANIQMGSVLAIDTGALAETVTVTAVTATTFSAVTTKAHNGTVTPFPIVDQAFAGAGWLNALPASGSADLATAVGLGGALAMLLDFARIKQALSPNDERLLAVLESPAAILADGSLALLALTGWAQDSVQALMQQFFGTTALGALTEVEAFARLFDAFAVVNTSRVSAAALIASTTNEPTAAAVGAFQSALRALYAETDWLTVVQPINDAMRIAERDALVAYILQQFGDGYGQAPVSTTSTADAPAGSTGITLASATGILAGMATSGPGIAAGTLVTAVAANRVTLGAATTADVPAGSSLSFVVDTSTINTPDKLFEYFLIDSQSQPPVQTSRIRLALSSVQLFIERVLRNLEPQVQPADLATLAAQWPWMKRYRVWQANREVFLWPENWLYPELRDDQSPLFKQAISTLLQGDIDQDAATSAYLTYLTGLEEVAKLEPCGLYYQPAVADAEDPVQESAYVVASTAGGHRKYYFRELQYGSWSPWTQVNIDCEDMPLTPVVWNGRLLLFWLKVLKQSSPQAPSSSSAPLGSIASLSYSQVQSVAQDTAQAQQQVTAQAVLCWCEYYNGQWQPPKTSDVNRPTGLGTFDISGPGALEAQRDLMKISPVTLANLTQGRATLPTIPDGALLLAVGSPAASSFPSGGFMLSNTHSRPVRFEDIIVWVRLGLPNVLPNLPFSWPMPLTNFVATPASGRYLSPIQPYTGGSAQGTFGISYWTSGGGVKTTSYANQLTGFNWIPRYVEPQLGLDDAWDAPFFYEDRHHLFYVTTSEVVQTINRFNGFGLASVGDAVAAAAAPPPLVVKQPPQLSLPDPAAILTGNVIGGGNPVAIQSFLSGATTLRAALGDADPVTYQGRQIYPTGSASAPTAINTPVASRGE